MKSCIISCEEFWIHKMFDEILDVMIEYMWIFTKNQEGQIPLWCDADKIQASTIDIHGRKCIQCFDEYFLDKHRLMVIPPCLRGSEGGHHIFHVSCTMAKTSIHKPSEGTSRENGGLNKHLGPIFFEDFNPR